MFRKVLTATTLGFRAGVVVAAMALHSAVPVVMAQKVQIGSSLTVPLTYMVSTSHVVNGEYIVYRTIEENSKNINAAGKNAGGFAVYKDKKEFKDNIVQGFVDVFDVATMQLKRSFPVTIPAKFGVKLVSSVNLTDKGAVLVLKSEENKDQNGKGYNITIRSLSYDGVVGEDSILVDRMYKDYYDDYAFTAEVFHNSTGDFYSYRAPAGKKQTDKNNRYFQFKRFNIFSKQVDNPITVSVNPKASMMRLNFVDGKPYFIYAANKVDSATIMPIKEGANFRTDGIHVATKPFLASEPIRLNGDTKYLLSIELSDNKNIKLAGYQVGFSGQSLTVKQILKTELDRKTTPEVDNFVDELKQYQYGGFVAASTETPTGPAFLIAARRYWKEGAQSGVNTTTGFIVEATSNVDAPKVIYHVYKSPVMAMDMFGTSFFGNMEYASAYYSGTSSYFAPKPYLVRFGPSLSEAADNGEIALTFTLRKVGDNYQILRTIDASLDLKVARFTGKKMYSQARFTTALLTVDGTGAVIPAESQRLEGSNKRSANVILPSRCILPDGTVIGLLQNGWTAQLIKY